MGWNPLACLFLFAAAVTPRLCSAQDGATGEPPSEDPATFYVLGNVEYVLLHELAHVLIEDLDIPIIGPEENAADYIATAALIRADLFDEVRAQRARQFLLATANGLATSWDFAMEAGQEIQYWDSHSLTIQRFYQIICLIYGSNPETFAALPARVGMPERRALLCPTEFARAERSLQWLLENYGRKAGDPEGAEVDVVFERVPTRASQRVVDAITVSGMLDNTVRRLHSRFTIRNPFRIVFRRCSQPQAKWFAAARELVICYELVDAYYALGLTQRSAQRQREIEELR